MARDTTRVTWCIDDTKSCLCRIATVITCVCHTYLFDWDRICNAIRRQTDSCCCCCCCCGRFVYFWLIIPWAAVVACGQSSLIQIQNEFRVRNDSFLILLLLWVFCADSSVGIGKQIKWFHVDWRFPIINNNSKYIPSRFARFVAFRETRLVSFGQTDHHTSDVVLHAIQ